MAVELVVPQAGESVQEVQVGEWRKRDGDYVERDELLVEVETDKAAMDLPAPASGRLSILKKQGELAKVGDVLASVDETAARQEPSARADDGRAEPARHSDPDAQARPRQPDQTPASATQSSRPETRPGASEPTLMPAARRAMAQAGLGPQQVEPSGPGGRVLKEDVQRAAAGIISRAQAPAPEQAPAATTGPRHEEAVPMSMLRKRVAQRLVEAQQTAAMLTTFNEADLSAVLQLRKEYNDAFEKKHGIKLGFMSFFVKAAIDALRLYPQINAEIRGSDIVYKNYFDIGVAVSSDRGLVVPVLRHAELMSFAQIEQAIADMARRARENKLTLEELEGGTFTITNGGVFGSLLSTPILNPPQSGILGLHATQERPVVRDGQIVARPMMYIALTYDHRIVDGREAVLFLRRIKDCIENPTRMLLEA